MKRRGTISIIESGVYINPVNGTVWITRHEIADLLGVVISTVDANLRAIFRPEVFVYSNRKVYHAKSYFRTYQQLLSIFSIE